MKIHTRGKREGKTEKKQRDMAVTNIKNSKVQGLEWIFFYLFTWQILNLEVSSAVDPRGYAMYIIVDSNLLEWEFYKNVKNIYFVGIYLLFWKIYNVLYRSINK